MQNITPLGITNWRNQNIPFGIKDSDRLGHIYCIGKTGVGKSTLLLNMAISDIKRGKGIAIIDPHSDVAQTILDYIPEERIQDVIYFNATDEAYPISFNLLKAVHPNHHHIVVSGLIATFKKIWIDFWGPRMEHILRFSLFTLLEYPNATLLDIQPLLTDPEYRKHVLSYVTNKHLLAFWYNEFEKYTAALKAEAIAPIVNKMGLFTAHPQLRNIVGAKQNGFQMLQVLDSSKILICNVSKGIIGEDASQLLGSMLVTAIQLAALSRAKYEPHTRTPFYLYVDEMQSFISLSFIDILAEARKYGLGLYLTHQYSEQIDERIRDAIFGNVGTVISFRIGAQDALYLAKEFHPQIQADDFINLPKYSMYLKLMIDGATSKPFSATTHPLQPITHSCKDEIIQASRKRYCRDIKKPVIDERISVLRTDGQGSLFE